MQQPVPMKPRKRVFTKIENSGCRYPNKRFSPRQQRLITSDGWTERNGEDLCKTMLKFEREMYKYDSKSNLHDKASSRLKGFRSHLVSRMFESHKLLGSSTASAYLAVYILDKYYANVDYRASLSNIKLVSLTCLIISSKYEDHNHSMLEKCANLTTFSVSDVAKMERHVLETICFNIYFPTVYTSLQLLATMLSVPENITLIAERVIRKCIGSIQTTGACNLRIAAFSLICGSLSGQVPIDLTRLLTYIDCGLADLKSFINLLRT